MSADADVDLATCAVIADNLRGLVYTVNRFRSVIASARGDDSEWMRYQLLFHIADSGPIRASTLAESVGADPSTVSRQVSALVKAGLIERRADPDDGRASLLVLTGTGNALHRRHLQRRDDHYSQMLRDWTTREQQEFAELLARFSTDFEAYKPVFLAEACAPRVPASGGEHE